MMKLPHIRLSFHRRAPFFMPDFGLYRMHSLKPGPYPYKTWVLYLGRVFIKLSYDRRQP